MEFSSRVFSYDHLLSDKKIIISAGELFQVSELSVIRSGEIAEHDQYCDEITYAVSGSAKFYSDDKCEEITSGQVHYIKKGAKHKIVAGTDSNFRYICIGFNPNLTYENIKSFSNMRVETDGFVKNDDGRIRRLMELLLNEFYMEDEQNNIMINLYLSQILISLARIYKGNISYMDKKSSSTSNYAVYKALRYIDRECIYITSVKGVAKELSYSEYYISHIFSEKVGMSMKEYIIKKKLQTAAQMLKTTNLSIGELSDYLNFSTPHTFRQAFKKVYLMSPYEYRKSWQQILDGLKASFNIVFSPCICYV